MAVNDYARLAAFLLGTLGFIIFLVFDIVKAFNTGAQWVPGGALVLSALTIQIMNLVENQSDQAFLGNNSDSARLTLLNDEAGNKNFFMMHSSRVMLCVLVALFIPGMARVRSDEKVNKILALGFSVILDIFSELLIITDSRFPSLYGASWNVFLVSDVLISTSLIWLMLLLFCATRATKSIRTITSRGFPFILEKPDHAEMSYERIEHQVLKSWIVARVCSPESIIAKSMLVSSAALVVTVCIISSVVGGIVHYGLIMEEIPVDAESRLKFMITILEIVFILIGWAVICWRSLTSIRYYGRWNESSWLKQFMVEDFWTRHILENLKEKEPKNGFQIADLWTKKMEAKESKKKLQSQGDIIKSIPQIKRTKWLLHRCLLLLQLIVIFVSKVSAFVIEVTIFVSKVSAFVIEVTLYNRVIRKIGSMVLPDHYSKEAQEYAHIFKNLNVVGENPQNVFVTNRKSIKQAKKLSEEGHKNGKEDCNLLIRFVKGQKSPSNLTGKMLPPLRVGVRGCLDRPTASEDETGLKFLCKCDSRSHLQVEDYFMYMREGSWSWKLTAVSLISIIVCLCPRADVIDSVYAYLEVWQLMDLVDEWDPETDSLLSKAADKEFNTLLDGSTLDSDNCCPDTMSMDQVAQKITQFAETKWKAFVKESKKLAGNKNTEPRESIMEDKEITVDWKLLAGAIALYKLCKGMNFSAGDVTELKKELRSSLADIMAACIDKVGIALVDKCRKWAQNLEEEKLLQAIYIAGKARGLMEALGTPDESSMV